MEYISNTLGHLIEQTAFMNLTWGNLIMIVVACVFLYLAIRHEFEPLLLVPIAFGMLLVNIYPDIMLHAEDSSNGVGGLLYYFYVLDEWAILPSLIFMGVGAMTDFGPLIANPKSFLLGAAAQFGIFAAYLGAMAMGFSDKAAAAISIIGGADGPTSIFLAGKLQQTAIMGPIAVAAYSYMSLVPIIQPPIMKLLTTEEERKIKMEQLRPVRDGFQCTDVYCCNPVGNFCRRDHKRRGIPECEYDQDRCARTGSVRIRDGGRRAVRQADVQGDRGQGESADRFCRCVCGSDGSQSFPEGWCRG